MKIKVKSRILAACYFLTLPLSNVFGEENPPKGFLNLEWNAYLHFFLDNREYERIYQLDETLYGSRQGLIATKDIGDGSKLSAGFDTLQEFGSRKLDDGSKLFLEQLPEDNGKTGEVLEIKKTNSVNLQPQKFFYFLEHKENNYNIYAGIFPHSKLGEVHQFLWDSRYEYYRPLVEGFLVQFPGIQSSIWLDWTSRQTKFERESFAAGIKSQLPLFSDISFDFATSLVHYAGDATYNQPVRDNAGAMIGFVHNAELSLFNIKSRLNYLTSLNRQRSGTNDETKTVLVQTDVVGKSILAEVAVKVQQVHFSALISSGKGDHQLMHGDSYYRAPLYSKLLVGWNFLQTKNVDSSLDFSYHITDKERTVAQSLKINMNI